MCLIQKKALLALKKQSSTSQTNQSGLKRSELCFCGSEADRSFLKPSLLSCHLQHALGLHAAEVLLLATCVRAACCRPNACVRLHAADLMHALGLHAADLMHALGLHAADLRHALGCMLQKCFS